VVAKGAATGPRVGFLVGYANPNVDGHDVCTGWRVEMRGKMPWQLYTHPSMHLLYKEFGVFDICNKGVHFTRCRGGQALEPVHLRAL
jgi:hypothetical protein